MKPDMKPETVARIRFDSPKAAWRPPTGPRYSTLCRFEGEEHGAPYGKWTLLIEFEHSPEVGRDAVASVKLLSESAPPLRRGTRFTLFEGPHVIGHGEVVKDEMDGVRGQLSESERAGMRGRLPRSLLRPRVPQPGMRVLIEADLIEGSHEAPRRLREVG